MLGEHCIFQQLYCQMLFNEDIVSITCKWKYVRGHNSTLDRPGFCPPDACAQTQTLRGTWIRPVGRWPCEWIWLKRNMWISVSLDLICGTTLTILHVFACRSPCLCSKYYYNAGKTHQLHLYFNITEESLNFILSNNQVKWIETYRFTSSWRDPIGVKKIEIAFFKDHIWLLSFIWLKKNH